MVFLLRWALDDSVDAVMATAVVALNALLVNHADEVGGENILHEFDEMPFKM